MLVRKTASLPVVRCIVKVVKGESTFTVNVCLSAVYTSVAMSHSKGSSTDYHVGTVVGGVSCLQEQFQLYVVL